MHRASRDQAAKLAAAYVDKRVFVTGAGGGIGREICRLLHDAGAQLIASDRTEDALTGVPGRHIPCDVTDAESVDDVFANVGPLDRLILVHGMTALSPLSDLPASAIKAVIDVNLTGAALCARAALPGLVQCSGKIGVLSSVSGFGPLIDRTAYSAAKHGLHGFFDSLRAEVFDQGVTVTIIAPSFVATGIEQRAAFRAQGQGGSWSTSGEIMEPVDVARAVLDGMAAGRRLVLPGRAAKKAWIVSRVSPRLYERLMRKRIRKSDSASNAVAADHRHSIPEAE